MNRFYFKNKNNPQKKCYEVYGIDVFTNIRYSLALCGTMRAAQKALDNYLIRLSLRNNVFEDSYPYEGLLFVEQTTIEEYEYNKEVEQVKRVRLRLSYLDEIYILQSHQSEIMDHILTCKDSFGSFEFQIGGEDEMDILDRECLHCYKYKVTKRYTDHTEKNVELALEIFFIHRKDIEYESNKDIPITETQLQDQSAVLFKGTDEALKQFMQRPWFADACMSFFFQASKNHYYGLERIHYLYQTPVYRDCQRTDDDFNNCFKGFILEPGYSAYMPGRKKVWYD